MNTRTPHPTRRPAAVVAAALLLLTAGAGAARAADAPPDAAGAGTPPAAAFRPEPASGGANVALSSIGARITGSSSPEIDSIYGADRLIDDPLSKDAFGGRWLPDHLDTAPWASVALPRPYLIDEARLAAYYERIRFGPSRVSLSAAGTLVDAVDVVPEPDSSVASAATGAAALTAVDAARVELGDGDSYLNLATLDLRTGQIGGTEVRFVDASTDADGTIAARLWDFGDGATSTEAAPTHVYAAPGEYDVTLTVTDDAGLTSSATHRQTVLGPPAQDFQVPAEAAEGDFATLRDDAVLDGPRAVAERTWRGNGPGFDVLDNSDGFAIRFLDSGTLELTSTVTDTAGLASAATHTVTVRNNPPWSYLTTDATGRHPADLGEPVTFQLNVSDHSPADAAALRCVLEPGGGLAPITVDPCGWESAVEAVYTEPGVHTARLTVTDPDGDSAQVTREVHVGVPPGPFDLVVTLDDTYEEVPVWMPIHQNLTLTNVGDSPAEWAQIMMELPPGVEVLDSADGLVEHFDGFTTIWWNFLRLEPGQSLYRSVAWKPPVTTPGGTRLDVTVRTWEEDREGQDPTPENNTATASLTVDSPLPLPGPADTWHLTNSLTGDPTALPGIVFGTPGGVPLLGDWDGDGIDTPGTHVDDMLWTRSTLTSGQPDAGARTGRAPGGEILVGDFDGDGRDETAGRYGNDVGVPLSTDSLVHRYFYYGRPDDEALVGDWDGDGRDTIAVRRGNAIHVRNSLSAGNADFVFWYGKPGEPILVGDFDGDGIDTVAIRRGDQVHIRNSLTSGRADRVTVFGRAGDRVVVADVDGDGRDTLGIRVAPGQ